MMLSAFLLFATIVSFNVCVAVSVRQGVLQRSEVWGSKDSPIRIDGELRIPKGITLTIEPDVTVEFGERGSIVVMGELRAIGTAAKPILFKGASEDLWKRGAVTGIIVSGTARPADELGKKGTSFKYCVFRHLRQPLNAEAKVYVGYCWFEDVGSLNKLEFAVTLRSGVIEFSRIRRCGMGALMLGEDAVGRYCLIEDGLADAIGGDAYLEHCTIRNFKRFALSEVGKSFELFWCHVSKCGTLAGLPNAEGRFPRIVLEDVTITDMGEEQGWGAIHIRKSPAPNERLLKINTRGNCNRVISKVLISDSVGGIEIVAQQIWWGKSNPDTSDESLFQGAGSKFNIFPVIPADPYLQRMSHEGAVVDAEGNLVADAMVWVLDSRTSPSSTNEDGVFRIDGSVPGVYTLCAYRPWVGEGCATADWAFAGEVCRTMGFAKGKQEALVIRLSGKSQRQ
jgi:hypothetical protein